MVTSQCYNMIAEYIKCTKMKAIECTVLYQKVLTCSVLYPSSRIAQRKYEV